MPLDTANFIGALDETLPLAGDMAAEGDDQIRGLKRAVRQSFPLVTAPVSATHTELNALLGARPAMQAQVDAKAPSSSPTFSGVPTAPTAAPGTATTQLATTGFVKAATDVIAGFNAAALADAVAAAQAAAVAAAASAGAVAWVSGTTYALGAVVWSPANRRLYRRIVAGAGTTDPSLDGTNWADLNPETLTATALFFASI
jgi:hypothetical protein